MTVQEEMIINRLISKSKDAFIFAIEIVVIVIISNNPYNIYINSLTFLKSIVFISHIIVY